MSSAYGWNAIAAGLAVFALGACASGVAAQPPDAQAAETAGAETADEAGKAGEDGETGVSTAELRAAIHRAPPLEQANFWAREYASDPGDLHTALKFAKSLRAIGSHERAAEIASQSAMLHPESPDVFLVMGRALASAGEHEKARGALLRAVMHAPESADALAALGLAHDRLGDHNSAQTAYRQALEIEPGRAATRSNLGLSLALSGQLDAAEVQLRKAVAHPDATVNVQQNLALVLGLKGDYEAARAVSEDAPGDVVERNLETLKAFRGDAPTPEGKPAAVRGLRGAISGEG